MKNSRISFSFLFPDRSRSCACGFSVLWLLPVVLAVALYFMHQSVAAKISKNAIGKPVLVSSPAYGKIESVHVKAGDFVEPGKEICNFVATDQKGNVPAEGMKTEEALFVTVKTVKGEKFTDFVELPGLVRPATETEISSQVNGQVLEMLIKEGSAVKKGDILVKVDKRDYELALANAQNAFDHSKRELERARNLVKSNASTTSNLDMAETDFRGKQNMLEMAKLALERCEITAPISGIIDQKFVEVGEKINDGRKIAKIIDISSVKVIVGIPEGDISYLKNSKNMSFVVPSLDSREFTGAFSNIVLSVGETAKVFPLVIDVKNDDGALLPGMVVRAKVIRKVHENAVMLPIFSIIPGDDEYFTYVYNAGKAKKRVIQLGTFQTKTVHIVSGLAPGDRVIDKGLRLVYDGIDVNLLKDEAVSN